jgi:hypothetical protein
MGSETEFAVSCYSPGGPMAPEEVVPYLVEAAGRIVPSLPDAHERVACYLANGSRVYREIGGKIEHATPECSSPAEVACYDKAGERILLRAMRSVAANYPGWRLAIFKNNVGAVAPDETTWGNHESYTCWIPIERAVKPLLGHLVSRLFYSGAGLLGYRDGGIGFELSQRARHLVQVTGSETTIARPLFGTRVRKPSDFSSEGWVRAHLICKDSQRAPFGIYLTAGTTCLLFHLLNTGRGVGQKLAPKDPIAAVRAISLDPWLKAAITLEDGRKLTALEIQCEYLDACERAGQAGALPDWAGALMRHWRETLEAWARDPLSLADRLDTASKLKVIDHELRRAGVAWTALNEGLKVLGGLRQRYPASVVRAVLADDSHGLPPEARSKFSAARTEITSGRRDRIEQVRLAARLQALDLKYHELGGLYDTLEADGRVRAVVVDPAAIDQAIEEPPPGARAQYRGNFIREHQHEGWACDWMSLVHRPSGQIIHLGDPFRCEPTAITPARPQPTPTVPGASESDTAEMEALSQLDLRMGTMDRERIASLLSRVFSRR